jgi:tRNA A37 methylthiotransferase MiaB
VAITTKKKKNHKVIEGIQRNIPNMTIRTTLIVGYPPETKKIIKR